MIRTLVHYIFMVYTNYIICYFYNDPDPNLFLQPGCSYRLPIHAVHYYTQVC